MRRHGRSRWATRRLVLGKGRASDTRTSRHGGSGSDLRLGHLRPVDGDRHDHLSYASQRAKALTGEPVQPTSRSGMTITLKP